ncbi:MAG TPA: PIN domain-containing protein [Caulobacteraceae bacterium]|jgi:predicted nucleic acid-binding protein|nr:PIN domain-containing protein [Caulobacteraceae bacterium]
MTTFLDTNVLIALLNDREPHHVWSVEQLKACKLNGPALISDIVYCEFSVGMATQAHVDAAVARFALERMPSDDAVLFRAGAAFKQYKAQKGQKTNVLPDFLIGAIAEVSGAPLVTANPKDFTGYFPNIQIIAP